MDIGILYKLCLVFCILGEETEREWLIPAPFQLASGAGSHP